MNFEFIQVIEKKTEERFLINLEDISFIREVKEDSTSIIRLKNKDRVFLHVLQSFDSLLELFNQNEDMA